MIKISYAQTHQVWTYNFTLESPFSKFVDEFPLLHPWLLPTYFENSDLRKFSLQI